MKFEQTFFIGSNLIRQQKSLGLFYFTECTNPCWFDCSTIEVGITSKGKHSSYVSQFMKNVNKFRSYSGILLFFHTILIFKKELFTQQKYRYTEKIDKENDTCYTVQSGS